MDFVTAFAQSAGWLQWTMPTVLALAISSAAVALAWMIGEAFKSSEIKGWAKKELNEFIYSCALAGMITLFLSTLYFLSLSLADGDIYTISTNFLNAEPPAGFSTWFHEATRGVGGSAPSMGLYYQSLNSAMTIGSKSFVYEMMGDIKYDLTYLLKGILKLIGLFPGATMFTATLSAAIPSMTINLFGAVDDISSALDAFSTTAYLGALLAAGQVQAIRFFQTAGLQIILPVGIILRTFPITRKTGATLIAIAIVGASVYPLSIVASKAIYDRTHDLFGAAEIIIPTSAGIVSVASPVDGTRVGPDDKIIWAVNKDSTFSIWVSYEDYSCEGSYSEGNDPPRSGNVYWKTGDATFVCHKRLQNSLITDTSDDNQVEMAVSTLTQEETDQIYSFILDAYDSAGQHTGWAESRVIVGDPCKRNFGTRLKCLFGKKYAIKDVSGSRSLETSLYSTLGGMVSSAIDIPSGFAYESSWFKSFLNLMTPVLASKAFLVITDKIPLLMFPAFMSIVSLVISAFVTLSAFRGLSDAIGGETELPGIGKIV